MWMERKKSEQRKIIIYDWILAVHRHVWVVDANKNDDLIKFILRLHFHSRIYSCFRRGQHIFSPSLFRTSVFHSFCIFDRISVWATPYQFVIVTPRLFAYCTKKLKKKQRIISSEHSKQSNKVTKDRTWTHDSHRVCSMSIICCVGERDSKRIMEYRICFGKTSKKGGKNHNVKYSSISIFVFCFSYLCSRNFFYCVK